MITQTAGDVSRCGIGLFSFSKFGSSLLRVLSPAAGGRFAATGEAGRAGRKEEDDVFVLRDTHKAYGEPFGRMREGTLNVTRERRASVCLA